MNISKGTKIGSGVGVAAIGAAVLGYFQLQEVIDVNTTTEVQLHAAIDDAVDPIEEQQARTQRRFDLGDYKFYVGKMCSEVNRQELSSIEQMDFDDILFRLNYVWRGC